MSSRKKPAAYTLERGPGPDGRPGARLSGRLDVDQARSLSDGLEALAREAGPGGLVLDVSGVEYLDSTAAMVLALAVQRPSGEGPAWEIQGGDKRTREILGLIDPAAVEEPPLITQRSEGNVLERLGEATIDMMRDVAGVETFLGELIRSFIHLFRHPGKFRWGDVMFYMENVGVNGLPIVGLISLLLGLIMAFMSSLQLQSFGADIYVATLVSVAMVRELGPIMTAILVAGRTGSSFAAEIGTMKVNEEVDALEVMGFNPTIFLAVPKVVAAVLTVPFLTLFADGMAILGGLIVGVVGLGLTPGSYMTETFRALGPDDIVMGFVKSAVFAILISGIGCQRGFTVSRGAEGVGRATTSAVVAALFLIIVTDSIFAILQYYVF